MVHKTKMEKAVSIGSSLILAATIATLGLGSPALAQALPAHAEGTGDVLPDYWDPDGGMHFGYTLQQRDAGLCVYTGPMFVPAMPQGETVAHGRRLYAYGGPRLWALRLRQH